MSGKMLLAGVVLLTSACGQEPKAPAPEKQTRAAPALRIDRPVEDILARIPPDQRASVQAALIFRVKANKGETLRITPGLVQETFGRLKADPSVTKC